MNQGCNKNRHILIISNGYPSVYKSLSGSFWKDQAEAFVKQNCKVGLIATTPISLKDIKTKGVKYLNKESLIEKGVVTSIFRFPNIPKLNFLESLIGLHVGFLLFKKYTEVNGLPDVIHVHRYEAGLLAIKIKKKYGIPFVVTEHSSRFLYNSLGRVEHSISKRVFQKADYCIAVSKSLASLLSKKYLTDFNYIPNIVDTSFFKRNKLIKKNISFSFFSAGNLDVNKNHRMLIDAFDIFLKKNISSNSRLYIAGDGPERESLMKQIKSLNLEKSVFLLSKLSRIDMVKFNNQCHVFVLPSIKETFGVVLIEALSTGLPVISTDSGGPRSIITHESLGEICDISKDALFCAMKNVYDNFEGYSSDRIVKFANDNFSKEKITSSLLKVYKKIL